jgi:hypothetical protein
MEFLPQEVKLTEIWKYLPYEDIVRLCQTNKEFSTICSSNETWKYLLQRDFRIIFTEENAYNLYILYKQALDYFSKFYPIITQRALSRIINVFPTSTWNDLGYAIEQFQEQIGLTSEFILSDLTVSDIRIFMIESGEFEQVLVNINRDMIGDEVTPEFNQILEELEESCDRFEEIISHPIFIFIHKQLTLINYDYELACDIIGSTEICYDEFDIFEKKILALAGLL